MAKYKLVFKKSVAKDLRSIPNKMLPAFFSAQESCRKILARLTAKNCQGKNVTGFGRAFTGSYMS